MKRIICCLLILIFSLSLCSCGRKSNTEGTESRPVVVLPNGDKQTVTIDISSINNSSKDTPSDPINMIYVGNKNSKIFHKENCKSVSNMKSENMISFSTIDEAIANDYKPCGVCLK